MAQEPAVPPTPPVPLAALLTREELALRQIAGPPADQVAVHWAQTSEMSDPYPYLLGGELLLTAGVHIPEAAGSGTYFDDYVARIVAAGGAALGFGVAPVHDTVPRALVAACETYGLPLVEVPPRTTFAAVARAVWRLMAEARTAELRRVAEAQRSLAAAASRPDPVPSVLRKLAALLGGRAALYGPGGAEASAAGREPAEGADAALAQLARFVTDRASSTATETVGGTRLAVYALGAGPQGLVLGVAAPDREPGDHTVASLAAVLLALLTGERHRAADPGPAADRTSALVRLLLGAAPAQVAPLLAGGGPGYVVHARPAGRAPGPDAAAAAALGAALGSDLVDVAGEVVRVIVPDGPEPAPRPHWTLGVSAPAGPAEWPAADAQAARALARARATRTPLVRHGARPVLADLVPAGEAAAHARAVLAPLAAHPALTETLLTWLSLHGNWDRTAVALSVHRNTVRQRVARCAALLKTDLDDPDVRMELWFALRHR
ncbi:PucR family transcriptional regulator ligand-binding domain-containing protein [Streptomyces fumanus]|uniref:PucR family transcriptional regulator ligand-binding domain-containing protein n=1 Tax=Streptomyces fumanus TaxID=67302 RepID=UPI0033C55A83